MEDEVKLDNRKITVESIRDEMRKSSIADKGQGEVKEAKEIIAELVHARDSGWIQAETLKKIVGLVESKEALLELMGDVERASRNIDSELELVMDLKGNIAELSKAVLDLVQKMDDYALDSAERWAREKQTLDLIDDYIKRNL